MNVIDKCILSTEMLSICSLSVTHLKNVGIATPIDYFNEKYFFLGCTHLEIW